MGSVLARVLPEPLRRVELRRIGRQLVDFQPVAVAFEPSPYLGVLVIGGIVLNQNGSSTAIVPGNLFFQEG